MKIAFICILLSLNAFSAIIEPQAMWNKRQVNVCFLDDLKQLEKTQFKNKEYAIENFGFNPEFYSSNFQTILKKIVEQSFSEDETGIHFDGWRPCSEENNYDVIIVKAGKIKKKMWFSKSPSWLGLSTIGQGIIDAESLRSKKDLGEIPAIAFNEPSKQTVLHEFLHLAGFRHEFIHPEDKDVKENEPYSLFTLFLSEYDRDSAMNGLIFVRSKNMLSLNDKKSLRMVYENPECVKLLSHSFPPASENREDRYDWSQSVVGLINSRCSNP